MRSPGKPDAVGESTYYVDSVANVVAFLYLENGGGYSRSPNMAPDGKEAMSTSSPSSLKKPRASAMK